MDECLPSRLEQGCLRKSAYGRTNLFLATNDVLFREVRCSASTMARQASASVFHMHKENAAPERNKDILCWHCCYQFEGPGFRLPRFFDPSEKTYHVYGWFCSANCAKAYILEHSTFDRGYQMNVFVRMLREVYGIMTSITESPPRLALKQFGGPFDIQSFRTQSNVCYIVTPPFVSYCMLIEEKQSESTVNDQMTSNIPKGTVRGLRRPDTLNSAPLETGTMCTAPLEGLYQKFKISCEEKEGSSSTAPLPKKQKKGNGLARFMCPATSTAP